MYVMRLSMTSLCAFFDFRVCVCFFFDFLGRRSPDRQRDVHPLSQLPMAFPMASLALSCGIDERVCIRAPTNMKRCLLYLFHLYLVAHVCFVPLFSTVDTHALTIGQMGGIRLIVNAMRTHCHNGKLLRNACAALANLSTERAC